MQKILIQCKWTAVLCERLQNLQKLNHKLLIFLIMDCMNEQELKALLDNISECKEQTDQAYEKVKLAYLTKRAKGCSIYKLEEPQYQGQWIIIDPNGVCMLINEDIYQLVKIDGIIYYCCGGSTLKQLYLSKNILTHERVKCEQGSAVGKDGEHIYYSKRDGITCKYSTKEEDSFPYTVIIKWSDIGKKDVIHFDPAIAKPIQKDDMLAILRDCMV